MFGLNKKEDENGLITSKLLDQDSFYDVFAWDIRRARREVIIESPFLSHRRVNSFFPLFRMLIRHGVKIVINTKPIGEQDFEYRVQTEQCITALQEIGADILFTGGHHRKLAVIDRYILYEGSLNILSQNDSCEIMRRIDSKKLAILMLSFTGLDKFNEVV